MNIDYSHITITVDRCEVSTIHSALLRGLKESIRTHWVNYPDAMETGAQELPILRELSRYHYSTWEQIKAEIDKELSEAIKKKEATQ
tara:strand:- start:263 stop:523 length:261 start_codon:yes stop_codon:yes gene_type:complete